MDVHFLPIKFDIGPCRDLTKENIIENYIVTFTHGYRVIWSIRRVTRDYNILITRSENSDEGFEDVISYGTITKANDEDIELFVPEYGRPGSDESVVKICDAVKHLKFTDKESDKDGNHQVIFTNKFTHSKVVLDDKIKKPILFKGLGMSFDENSKLLIPILRGSKTSYSYKHSAITDTPHTLGKKTILVAGLQCRNSARITFVGSLEMLSNNYFSKSSYDNKLFAEELTKWNFKERGILRRRDIKHHKVNSTTEEMQSIYRIKDEIYYSVIFEEFRDDKWVPYISDDIQVELVMLDPYIRVNLKHEKNGKHSVIFQIPDVYGVFKFRVEYTKMGYSSIIYSDKMPIRPLRLNEYERYIASAYPYYLSTFTMMAGFFIFGIFFIYTKDEKIKND